MKQHPVTIYQWIFEYLEAETEDKTQQRWVIMKVKKFRVFGATQVTVLKLFFIWEEQKHLQEINQVPEKRWNYTAIKNRYKKRDCQEIYLVAK